MKSNNLFIAKWASAQELSQKLGLMMVGAVITILVLIIVIVYQAIRPQPIYFISAQPFGYAYSGNISADFAGLLAQVWLNNWDNYTPITVEDNRRYALKLLSPRLLAKIQQRIIDDIKQIKTNRVSSFLTLQEQPRITTQDRKCYVELMVSKDTYTDSQLVTSQLLNVRVILVQTPKNQSNPFGLAVDDIEQEEIK